MITFYVEFQLCPTSVSKKLSKTKSKPFRLPLDQKADHPAHATLNNQGHAIPEILEILQKRDESRDATIRIAQSRRRAQTTPAPTLSRLLLTTLHVHPGFKF